MLVALALGYLAGKAVTPMLPSTLTVVGLLVGTQVYTFIMMKGHENRAKVFLQVLTWNAVLAAMCFLRHELVMGDPEVQALMTNSFICGDTPQNLCNLAHLKYYSLLAWVF